MKKNTDKVYEAYYDNFGSKFGDKVRERIHWACSNALGNKILDVGCSQGITSIILGREGKEVVGIDISKDAIEFAIEQMNNEEESTKGLLRFFQANFMIYDFQDLKFDSIILTEVLEHMTQPLAFIKKSYDLLNPNGNIIITVPFGINDYFDHKKTYYLKDLLNEVIPFYEIENVQFFGEWIGVLGKKKESVDISERAIISEELVSRLEKAFYELEKSKHVRLKQQLFENSQLKSKINELKEENLNLKQSLPKENLSQLKSDFIQTKNDLENLKQKYRELEKENEKLINDFIEEKKVNISTKTELVDSINQQEKLVLRYKNIANKYNTLSNSKLGKITLKYWRFRNK